MSYQCVRCGHGQNAHDINLSFKSAQIQLLDAETTVVGFEMSLVSCTLSPRLADYVTKVTELCNGKTPVQALGIGGGYVSPAIAEEYAAEMAFRKESQAM